MVARDLAPSAVSRKRLIKAKNPWATSDEVMQLGFEHIVVPKRGP